MMTPVLETIAILNGRRNKPAASDCYDASVPRSAESQNDEIAEKFAALWQLKTIVAAGQQFGCSVLQRHLRWGYNKSYRLMEYAVANGLAEWGETENRIQFKPELTEYRCSGCGVIVMKSLPWVQWKLLPCAYGCGERRFVRVAS